MSQTPILPPPPESERVTERPHAPEPNINGELAAGRVRDAYVALERAVNMALRACPTAPGPARAAEVRDRDAVVAALRVVRLDCAQLEAAVRTLYSNAVGGSR